MGYAVYHSEKGSISSGGLGHHIDRTPGREYTYKHADLSLTKLNKNAVLSNDYHLMRLSDAIEHRIKKGYTSSKAIRKDAVKYLTHILTGSHEEMKEIFSDEKKSKEWINSNFDWICQEFGKENIVRFSVHLDEKTPHIHAVTVPLTQDGRLSAKEVMGNKKAMQQRQDRYAEKMKVFGLERGIKSTGVKHESAREYYARIKEGLKFSSSDDNLEVWEKKKGVLSLFSNEKELNHIETLENYKRANLSLKTALNEELNKKNELKKLLKGNENLNKAQNEVKKLGESIYTLKIQNDREISQLKQKIRDLENPSKEYFQKKLTEVLAEESKTSILKQKQEYSRKVLERFVSSAITNAISESQRLGTRLTYDVIEFHFEEVQQKSRLNQNQNFTPLQILNEIEKQLEEKNINLSRGGFRRI